MERRHQIRTRGGVIVVATGAVWIGQGSGLLTGSSFMVGDPLWIVFGALAIAIGIGLIWVGLRGRG